MKRIFGFLLLLQLAMISYCHAYTPDPYRWQYVSNNIWYDKETIDYYISDDPDHRGHQMVDGWILNTNGNNTYFEGHSIFDLNCHGFWAIVTKTYDKRTRKLISVVDDTGKGFNPVHPGTYGMIFYNAMSQAWHTDPNNPYRDTAPKGDKKGNIPYSRQPRR